MTIQFDKKYLHELYVSGKCSDKKHRFQPIVVKNYIKCVSLLSKVQCIEDLFPIHALNYEVLSGDKQGTSSVRINNQYRLEFRVSINNNTEPIATICIIDDITNHYQ